MKCTILVCTLASLGASSARSQATTPQAAMPAAPGFNQMYVTAGPALSPLPPLNPQPVLNMPYQADSETETIQHLADGNTIRNTNRAKLARDSQGRTRTEQTIDRLGPWSSENGTQTIVFLSDPVSGNSYTLHPENKTAERFAVRINKADVIKARPADATTLASPPVRVSVVSGIGPGEAPVTFAATTKMGPESADQKVEELGTRQVNGVMAEGKRITVTIPANAVGNQQPLVTMHETWYSRELQMVVESKRVDPRFGETRFSLKNIELGEPPADLFQIPSDYTVNEPPKAILRLKQ